MFPYKFQKAKRIDQFPFESIHDIPDLEGFYDMDGDVDGDWDC